MEFDWMGHSSISLCWYSWNDKVSSWCATRLGYPLNDIELQSAHLYACFEEATLEYSNQVNQFAIRDNMLQLQGANGTGVNLTGKPINATLGRLMALSKNYGTEAGSGGYNSSIPNVFVNLIIWGMILVYYFI